MPIEGEPGVGYRLRYKLDVPPLMFDASELEALLIGSRMVQAWGDADLAQAATAALAKIHNVLPEALRREAQQACLFVPGPGPDAERPVLLTALRQAARTRKVIRVAYRREDGTPSERDIWPLGLFFWGRQWTLVGWCLLREGFRHFRVDRIERLDVLAEVYPDTPGRRLGDFFDELERREGIKVPRR